MTLAPGWQAIFGPPLRSDGPATRELLVADRAMRRRIAGDPSTRELAREGDLSLVLKTVTARPAVTN